jgi:hypothetical protein
VSKRLWISPAEMLHLVSGFTLWPADRVEYERNLATIRAALSEAAFAAAWAEDQAMRSGPSPMPPSRLKRCDAIAGFTSTQIGYASW